MLFKITFEDTQIYKIVINLKACAKGFTSSNLLWVTKVWSFKGFYTLHNFYKNVLKYLKMD